METSEQVVKKKIAYIITLPNLGGAQSHLFEVIRNIRFYEISPFLITGCEGWLTDKVREFGVTVYIVPELVREISPQKDIKAIRRIGSILKKEKPFIVHCHSSKAGIIGRIAARLCSIPAIFTAHGWAFTDGVSSKKRRVYRWVENLTGYITKKIICVSEYDRQLGMRCLPAHKNKMVTIHNCISDMPEFMRDWDKTPIGEILHIVVVARFSPQKRNIQALHILRELLDDGLNVNMTFIGDGPDLLKAKEEAKILHLGNEAVFLGARTDVVELLPQYDLFLLLSNWEGFPISILEAMRAGLPVIASDVGGVKEAITDSNCLVGVDENKCENTLKSILKNDFWMIEIGKHNRDKFKKEFSLDRMMICLSEVYNELLKNRV